MSRNNDEFTYKEWVIIIILILLVIYYLFCNYNETFGVVSKESCLKWNEKKNDKFFYRILLAKNKERCNQAIEEAKNALEESKGPIQQISNLDTNDSNIKSALVTRKIRELTNEHRLSMLNLNKKIDMVVTDEDLEDVLQTHKELLSDLATQISSMTMQSELGTISEESESVGGMYKLLDDHKGLLKSIHRKSLKLNTMVDSEMKLLSSDLTDGLSDLNDDMDILSNKIDNIDISEDVTSLSESVDSLSDKIDSLGGVSAEGEENVSPLIKIGKRIKKLTNNLEVLFKQQNTKLSFDIDNKIKVLSEDVEDLSDLISSQDKTLDTLETEVSEMKKFFEEDKIMDLVLKINPSLRGEQMIQLIKDFIVPGVSVLHLKHDGNSGRLNRSGNKNPVVEYNISNPASNRFYAYNGFTRPGWYTSDNSHGGFFDQEDGTGRMYSAVRYPHGFIRFLFIVPKTGDYLFSNHSRDSHRMMFRKLDLESLKKLSKNQNANIGKEFKNIIERWNKQGWQHSKTFNLKQGDLYEFIFEYAQPITRTNWTGLRINSKVNGWKYIYPTSIDGLFTLKNYNTVYNWTNIKTNENKKLTTPKTKPYMYKDFELEFKLKINAFKGENLINSLLHFTFTGKDNDNIGSGSKAPLIAIQNKKLCIMFNNKLLKDIKIICDKELKINENYKIKIVNIDLKLSVFIDKEEVEYTLISDKILKMNYLGCYNDDDYGDNAEKLLKDKVAGKGAENGYSVSKCFRNLANGDLKHKYFGLSEGGDCFSSDINPNDMSAKKSEAFSKVSDDKCNAVCKGDENEKCGGKGRNRRNKSVYEINDISEGITLIKDEIERKGGKDRVDLEKFNIDKNFSFSFKITPTKKVSGWNNVMKFSNSSKDHNGNRTFAIWFYSNTTKMHVRVRHGNGRNETNWGSDPNYQLPLNEESHVKIMLVDNKQTIIIQNKTNGTKIFTATTPNANNRYVGKLNWASIGDSLYKNSEFKIKDFKYNNVDNLMKNIPGSEKYIIRKDMNEIVKGKSLDLSIYHEGVVSRPIGFVDIYTGSILEGDNMEIKKNLASNSEISELKLTNKFHDVIDEKKIDI